MQTGRWRWRSRRVQERGGGILLQKEWRKEQNHRFLLLPPAVWEHWGTPHKLLPPGKEQWEPGKELLPPGI
ncbi:hypothetical protein BH10PLA1_BH10PLA1_15060 [soil metagenome]